MNIYDYLFCAAIVVGLAIGVYYTAEWHLMPAWLRNIRWPRKAPKLKDLIAARNAEVSKQARADNKLYNDRQNEVIRYCQQLRDVLHDKYHVTITWELKYCELNIPRPEHFMVIFHFGDGLRGVLMDWHCMFDWDTSRVCKESHRDLVWVYDHLSKQIENALNEKSHTLSQGSSEESK